MRVPARKLADKHKGALARVPFYLVLSFAALSLSPTQAMSPITTTCGPALANLSQPEVLIDPALAKLREIEAQLRTVTYQVDPTLYAIDLRHMMQVENAMNGAYPRLLELAQEFRESRGLIPRDRALEWIAQLEADSKTLLQKPRETFSRDYDLWGLQHALKYIENSLLMSQTAESKHRSRSEPENPNPPQKPKPKPSLPRPPPRMSSQMSATNHDFANMVSSGGPVGLFQTVNVKGIRYYRERVFGVLNLQQSEFYAMGLPPSRRVDPGSTSKRALLRVYSLGLKNEYFPIFVPEGFIPETYTNGASELTMDDEGAYYLKTSQDYVDIPLIPEVHLKRPLSQQEKDFYLAGPREGEIPWPQWFQDLIAQIKAEKAAGKYNGYGSHYKLAARLANAMAHFEISGCEYAVDPSTSDTSALKLLESKKFQCSTAALILASVLRSEFQIPARVVGGYASNAADTKGQSALFMPGIPHAWVEIFDELEQEQYAWVPVDGQPKKFTRELDLPEHIKDQVPSQGRDESPAPSGGETQSMDDLIEAIRKRDQVRHDEIKKRFAATPREDPQKPGSETKAESPELTEVPPHLKKIVDAEAEWAKASLTDFEVGLLYEAFMQWALDPQLPSSDKLRRLHKFYRMLQRDRNANLPRVRQMLGPIIKNLMLMFEEDRPSYRDWLRQISATYERRNPVEIYYELRKMAEQIQETIRRSPALAQNFPLLEYLNQINQIRKELQSIRHKDSNAIHIARDTFQHLPGSFSRQLLTQQYGLPAEMADDAATVALGRDLIAGKLDNFRLASLLKTEWLVAPTVMPSTTPFRVPIEDAGKVRGRPWYGVVTEPGQIPSSMNLNPGLSIGEAFANGSLVRRYTPRSIQRPYGTQETQPKKLVVLLYDLSGSMSGARAQFQTELLRSYVDRALSEKLPDGSPKNEVLLVGFGSKVFGKTLVRTPEDALQAVGQMSKLAANLNSGTLGTEALEDVAKYLQELKAGGKFTAERLTLVMLTDGGFTLDVPKVKAAYNPLRASGLEVIFAFGAIGGTNPHFIDLVDHQAIQGSKLVYFEWTDADIEEVMSRAKVHIAEDEQEFWTNEAWSKVAATTREKLRGLRDIRPMHPKNQKDSHEALEKFRAEVSGFKDGRVSFINPTTPGLSSNLMRLNNLRIAFSLFAHGTGQAEREHLFNLMLQSERWQSLWRDLMANERDRGSAYAMMVHFLNELEKPVKLEETAHHATGP